MDDAAQRARYRDVFGIGEFRTMWIAQAQSRLGDQVARVALSLLVFDRTHSAGLTALVLAMTFLPPLFSAPLLAGLADRYPRRTVMVVTDLIRGALVAVMAIPAVPLGVLVVLVIVMVCGQPPFAAARNATLPTVLPGDAFTVGMGIVQMTDFLGQVVGFAGGGLMVAHLGGPRPALALDAATYFLSAALLRFGIRPHLASDAEPSARRPGFALAGLRVLWDNRPLLGLVSMVWMFGFFIAPEGLAAPYAAELGRGPDAVGLLLAADPVGAFVGAFVVTRLLPPAVRVRLIVPLGLATGVPLVLSAIAPSLVGSLLLWALSGAFTAYIIVAQTVVTRSVDDAVRARTIGVASAGLQTFQGLGVLVAGGIAELYAPSVTVAIMAVAGIVGMAAVWLLCRPDRAGAGEPEPAPA